MLNGYKSSYTYSNTELLECLKNMKEGTFSGMYPFRRDILIQARARALIKFDGEDCDAHKVSMDQVVYLEQEIMQRGHHGQPSQSNQPKS